MTPLGSMAIRLGLIFLSSNGNILPSGVRAQTAQEIGFVMINFAELSDD